MKFMHTTRAEFLAEVRATYAQADGVDAAKIAGWIAKQSDEDMMGMFGDLTKSEIAAQKKKLAEDGDKLTALRAVKGK